MRKALRIILWIIAFFLFPITAGLYFVWPSKILKERLSPNWRRFWWITYGFVAIVGIASKIWFYVLVPCVLSYSGEPFTTCENVQTIFCNELILVPSICSNDIFIVIKRVYHLQFRKLHSREFAEILGGMIV